MVFSHFLGGDSKHNCVEVTSQEDPLETRSWTKLLLAGAPRGIGAVEIGWNRAYQWLSAFMVIRLFPSFFHGISLARFWNILQVSLEQIKWNTLWNAFEFGQNDFFLTAFDCFSGEYEHFQHTAIDPSSWITRHPCTSRCRNCWHYVPRQFGGSFGRDLVGGMKMTSKKIYSNLLCELGDDRRWTLNISIWSHVFGFWSSIVLPFNYIWFYLDILKWQRCQGQGKKWTLWNLQCAMIRSHSQIEFPSFLSFLRSYAGLLWGFH